MSRHLLLVEDNATDEKLTLHVLRRAGFDGTVTVARDGAEALALLLGDPAARESAPVPDLVLLDLKLPRIGGLDVLRRIRADARIGRVPVVVLTASREDDDVDRSYRLGANAYVRKPVDLNLFLEAARSIVAFWCVLNEPARPARGTP